MKLLSSLFLAATVSLSVLAEDIDSLIIKVPNVFGAFEAKEGKDGRMVIYPKLWATKEGKDGRLVAYPKGWKAEEGRDGRLIAQPPGWRTREEGKDGRRSFRPFGWSSEEGKDGRRSVRPFGWSSEEGKDGRKVIKPFAGKTLMGKDGRRVVVPNGELLFQKADTVAILYAAKKELALKEWYNLVLYRFINAEDKSLQKGVAGNQDALVKRLLGAKIYSQEKPPKYLGKIAGELDRESIFNELGPHGSELAADSIWNELGIYGSELSVHSPFNELTATPPMIVSDNKIIGYLTVNTLIRGGLTPDTVKRLITQMGNRAPVGAPNPLAGGGKVTSIKSIDTIKGTITLDDGTTLPIMEKYHKKLAKWKIGTKIIVEKHRGFSIIKNEKNGRFLFTEIAP